MEQWGSTTVGHSCPLSSAVCCEVLTRWQKQFRFHTGEAILSCGVPTASQVIVTQAALGHALRCMYVCMQSGGVEGGGEGKVTDFFEKLIKAHSLVKHIPKPPKFPLRFGTGAPGE